MKPWLVLTGINLILNIGYTIMSLGRTVNYMWVLPAFYFSIVCSFVREIKEEARAGEDCQTPSGTLEEEMDKEVAKWQTTIEGGEGGAGGQGSSKKGQALPPV